MRPARKTRNRTAVVSAVLALLLMGICQAGAQTQPAPVQTQIPDTPAGRVLRAWLDAFNSGDRAILENYIKTFDPKQSIDVMLNFRSQTGGLDLLPSRAANRS